VKVRRFTKDISCPHCGRSFIFTSDVPLPSEDQFDVYRSIDDVKEGAA
jgi:hypothetical protein